MSVLYYGRPFFVAVRSIKVSENLLMKFGAKSTELILTPKLLTIIFTEKQLHLGEIEKYYI